MTACEAGQLIFPLKDEDVAKAKEIVGAMHIHKEPLAVLQEQGCECCTGEADAGDGPVLMVVYSDFNVDDLMAVTQLWELKKAKENMLQKPVLIWHVNFDKGDSGQMFEKKLLVKSLMVGNLGTHVLAHEGDKGGAGKDEVGVQPHANEHIAARGQRIATIAEKLAAFTGASIHFYMLSPGKGNIGAIVNKLKQQGNWPLKAKWRVSQYAGQYNIKGMLDPDFAALSEIAACDGSTFTDISSFPFFGNEKAHPCTKSVGTFCLPNFAAETYRRSSLLTAAMNIFNDEFLLEHLHPRKLMTAGSPLYAKILEMYTPNMGRLQDYAAAALNDPQVRAVIPAKMQQIFEDTARGSLNFPLCDNVLFLYEWLQHEHPDWFTMKQSYIFRAGVGQMSCTTATYAPSSFCIYSQQPVLVDPSNEEQLMILREAMAEYFWMHLDRLTMLPAKEGIRLEPAEKYTSPMKRGEKTRTSMGLGSLSELNLCYPVTIEQMSEADSYCRRLREGETFKDVLGAGGADLHPALNNDAATADEALMVVYSDLEPDDTMAIAQLWQWKRERLKLRNHPMLISHADFEDKDKDLIFEKKRLIAAMMLSERDFHTLLRADDTYEELTHPLFDHHFQMRTKTLQSIAATLSKFKGKYIDFYILAPGHGNLGAIVQELKRIDCWPLQAKWRVNLYSGAFNMKGMFEADFEAMSEIMEHSAQPLVDMSKFPFFGGKDSHRWAGSLTSFATPDFAKLLTDTHPLLAAAMKSFNDEFNVHLIEPQNRSLFRGSELTEAEKERFKVVSAHYLKGGPTGLKDYAQALLEDEEIFDKVVGFKKNTLRAFADGGCDSPLCDQLVFLYEWLVTEHPEYMDDKPPGWWHYCNKKCFTYTSEELDTEKALSTPFKAIQPTLKSPKDESSLLDMRLALQDTLLRCVRVNLLRDRVASIVDVLGSNSVVTKDAFKVIWTSISGAGGVDMTTLWNTMVSCNIVQSDDSTVDVKEFVSWALV